MDKYYKEFIVTPFMTSSPVMLTSVYVMVTTV